MKILNYDQWASINERLGIPEELEETVNYLAEYIINCDIKGIHFVPIQTQWIKINNLNILLSIIKTSYHETRYDREDNTIILRIGDNIKDLNKLKEILYHELTHVLEEIKGGDNYTTDLRHYDMIKQVLNKILKKRHPRTYNFFELIYKTFRTELNAEFSELAVIVNDPDISKEQRKELLMNSSLYQLSIELQNTPSKDEWYDIIKTEGTIGVISMIMELDENDFDTFLNKAIKRFSSTYLDIQKKIMKLTSY